jgi:hypothetical protein
VGGVEEYGEVKGTYDISISVYKYENVGILIAGFLVHRCGSARYTIGRRLPRNLINLERFIIV